jgi:hypothetical protein
LTEASTVGFVGVAKYCAVSFLAASACAPVPVPGEALLLVLGPGAGFESESLPEHATSPPPISRPTTSTAIVRRRITGPPSGRRPH